MAIHQLATAPFSLKRIPNLLDCVYMHEWMRARHRQKRPGTPAKALSSASFQPKVEVDRLMAARLIRSAKHKTKLQ